MIKNLNFEIFHYSKNPVKLDFTRKYEVIPDNFVHQSYKKPYGLWVSGKIHENDLDWCEWCHKEDFEIGRLKYKHKIQLKITSKILIISNDEEFLFFENKYKCDIDYIIKDPNFDKKRYEKYEKVFCGRRLRFWEGIN